jgi:hypothetical protein
MPEMIKVISLDEAEKAFRKWTEHVWDANGTHLIIEKKDARRAAEAFFGQIQINRGEQTNLRRLK